MGKQDQKSDGRAMWIFKTKLPNKKYSESPIMAKNL
jgi:hypothetical protein